MAVIYITYNPTTWVNNTSPAINAANLNNIEQGIARIYDWSEDVTLGFEDINQDIENLDNRIAIIEPKLNQAINDISNLQVTVNDLVSRMSAVENAVELLDDRMGIVEDDISTINNTITLLENRIRSNEDNIVDLTSRVTTNELHISENASYISTLQAKVASLESITNDLIDDMANHTHDCSTLFGVPCGDWSRSGNTLYITTS